MNAILSFKNLQDDDLENCPCGLELKERLNDFHSRLMSQVSLTALQEPSENEEEDKSNEKQSKFLKVYESL